MLELQTLESTPTLRKSLEPDYATTLEPAIDLVHLARQTDGDDALEAELLAMFDRQAAKIIMKLSASEAPPRERADIAHKLRGSATAIGAWRVAKSAQDYENACESATHGGLEPSASLAALISSVEEARAVIAALQG
jgi:HPt (histidine-containing phosphotransfer) domain-containing protein